MKGWFIGMSAFIVGCGTATVDPPPTPLTIAEWKALPVEQKYIAETFERLKDGETSLRDEAGWETFRKNVLTPSRLRELPKSKK